MLPFAASGYEIGARFGEIAAPKIFGLLALLLVRRAVHRRRAEAACTAEAVLTPPPAIAPASDASASVGPPGWETPARSMPTSRPSRAGRTRTSWRSDALAAAVFGALFVGALVRGIGHDGGRSPDSSASDQWRALHAGFVEGCRRNDPSGVIPCECIFEQLKARAPGPVQFVQLTSVMEAAWQARDLRLLRPEIVEAFRACPAGAS